MAKTIGVVLSERVIAGLVIDLAPAVAEHGQTLLGNGVDPLEVGPALLLGVGLLTVKFYAQVIVVVQVVQVPARPPGAQLSLPPRGWQAMRPLDEADVAVLKQRVHAGVDQAKRLGEPTEAPTTKSAWTSSPDSSR